MINEGEIIDERMDGDNNHTTTFNRKYSIVGITNYPQHGDIPKISKPTESR